MVSTKHVILADGSRLLREMLHQALEKTDHLKVVEDVLDREKLPLALQRFDPEWVIVPLPYNHQADQWLERCMEAHPTVGFIFLPPGQNHITMKWQSSYEEDFTDLSLQEFIHILEKDLHYP